MHQFHLHMELRVLLVNILQDFLKGFNNWTIYKCSLFHNTNDRFINFMFNLLVLTLKIYHLYFFHKIVLHKITISKCITLVLMNILYSLFLNFVQLILPIVGLFNPRIKRFIIYRKKYLMKLIISFNLQKIIFGFMQHR